MNSPRDQPPSGLSDLLANMSINQQNTIQPPCHIEKRPDLQIVQFSTGEHNSRIIVPHSFVQWTNEHDITQLLEARWQEHLIEEHLLCGGNPRRESQDMLLNCRLERARLELELYNAAIELQMKSRAGHATCSSTFEPVDINDLKLSDYDEVVEQ